MPKNPLDLGDILYKNKEKQKKVKKKHKKLERKLHELDRELYENNSHVSREEFLVAKLSGRVKEYYNRLTPDRKDAFIGYILRQEDWENRRIMDQLEDTDQIEAGERRSVRKYKKLSDLVLDLRKEKKRSKSGAKSRHLIKTKKGLYYLLNPEAYDQTLLNKKKYRKYLRKLADKQKDNNPIELDCTLKGFKDELMRNQKVNKAVIDGFWNKHGY